MDRAIAIGALVVAVAALVMVFMQPSLTNGTAVLNVASLTAQGDIQAENVLGMRTLYAGPLAWSNFLDLMERYTLSSGSAIAGGNPQEGTPTTAGTQTMALDGLIGMNYAGWMSTTPCTPAGLAAGSCSVGIFSLAPAAGLAPTASGGGGSLSFSSASIGPNYTNTWL